MPGWKMPEMGSQRALPNGKHKGIRLWPVRGFGNYWIAYYAQAGGVAVERLFHSKQDYQRILE
jgi:plasmid stabilization system protein ParE